MKDSDSEHRADGRGAAERAAREQSEAERERGASRPFEYPCPERRAGVRARHHISEEEADADIPPGVPGGYGTTGGGRSSGTAAVHPTGDTRRHGRGRGQNH
ncbi:hypothetical protein [Streptomyces sp. NPDC051636]|uniref:hypothetical protein n=1 Tax=Streptomyces sp. NPDC051636 TaxID=3365663 RepID=UPI0037B4FD7F